MEFELPKFDELKPGNAHKILITVDFDTPVITSSTDDIGAIHEAAVAKMKSGIAHFRFRKKDGTVREAFGTLHGNLLAAHMNTEGYEKGVARSSATSQSYFDLIANDWRAYVIANIITLF